LYTRRKRKDGKPLVQGGGSLRDRRGPLGMTESGRGRRVGGGWPNPEALAEPDDKRRPYYYRELMSFLLEGGGPSKSRHDVRSRKVDGS